MESGLELEIKVLDKATGKRVPVEVISITNLTIGELIVPNVIMKHTEEEEAAG